MLGKAGIGKSTFGNFLIWEWFKSFKVSADSRSYSLTRSVQSVVTTLSPETVSGLGFRDQNAIIRIKVIDQPGMDDAQIYLRTQCDNLVKCLENLNATSATFLIVVNLNSDRLSDDRCLLLTQLSELLTQASYSFFSHAIIVFTHADEVVIDVNNKAELIQVVRRKIQELPGWEEMGEILQAVNERCIFVNGTSLDENYRIQIMKELFDLSKNTLTIRFHGNDDFTSEYLQSKMDVRGDGIVQEEFYNLDLQFHPDLNLFWRDEYRGNNLEKQMENAIQTMISLGEGVSAMVVLISLVTPFSAPMKELILKLPGCYIPGEPASWSLVEQWWKQAFIVFKVANEGCARSFVQTNIEMNPRIKSLVGKVSNRWTWVTEDTTPRMCRDRMTEMCIAVRKEVAGRNFIQNTVIKEIKGKMKESKDLEGKKTEVKVFTQEFHNLMAEGPLAIMESNNPVFVKLGGIPFKHKISVKSIWLILKSTRLSEEQIKRFKAKYTNPQDRVSIEEVLLFLAN